MKHYFDIIFCWLMVGALVCLVACSPNSPIDNHDDPELPADTLGIHVLEYCPAMGQFVNVLPKYEDGDTHETMCRKAEQMFQECMAIAEQQDIMILSAAVADFTPAQVAPEKIKKVSDSLDLHLVKTRDILATLGSRKREDQLLIGFALETEHEIENATRKLHTKNADVIVLNSLRDKGAGFGTATNKVMMITKEGKTFESELKDKHAIANDILDVACTIIKQ